MLMCEAMEVFEQKIPVIRHLWSNWPFPKAWGIHTKIHPPDYNDSFLVRKWTYTLVVEPHIWKKTWKSMARLGSNSRTTFRNHWNHKLATNSHENPPPTHTIHVYGTCQNDMVHKSIITCSPHRDFLQEVSNSWFLLGIVRFFSCITQPYKHGSPHGCRWALHEKPAGVSVSIAVLIHFSFHQFITGLYLSHRVVFWSRWSPRFWRGGTWRIIPLSRWLAKGGYLRHL